jgi:hypothetical protein
MPCEVLQLRVDFFQNGYRCHGNGQNAKKNEKHKNDHSRLLAKQILMKLDRNNNHMNKPKKSESVGQTLPQLPWKRKRGDLKKNGFLSSNFMKLCRNIHRGVWKLLAC